MPVAVITGASRGLGRAVAFALADRGWHLIVDSRNPAEISAVGVELTSRGAASVSAVSGSVADLAHREALRRAVEGLVGSDGLDLLVNNASLLGPSPQPHLAAYPLGTLEEVYAVNVLAPLALTQALLPLLRKGVVVNVTSDAAVEAYDGWGGYGSAKAALDQLTAVLAVEESALRVYAFDPGDMRTRMHQDAFPDEDISDRPEPETVVPALLRLVDEPFPSGRYRAADLRTAAPPAAGARAEAVA